jgi:hypothetical protein
MRGMMKHFGHKGLILGAALGVLAWAGCALAAGNEVRLPVEKTVRLAPPPETATEPAKPEKKAEPAVEAPKAEIPKPDVPKPAAKKDDVSKVDAVPAPKVAAKAKPKAPEAAPAAPDDAAAKPAAETKPAPKPAPKPKPEPKVDPLALELPPAPAPHEPTALPEGGQLVGDVELEFLADRIILRAATSGPVERLTYFGLTGPRKLALDLRGPWRKKGAGVLRFDVGPVKNVVTGEHPDRLRLAVEFREGAVAADMQPTVELGPKGAVVTIPLAVRLKR